MLSNTSLANIPLKLGFLASHNGTTMRGIIEKLNIARKLKATVCVVISNNSSSPALKFAMDEKIPARHISKSISITSDATDKAIRDCLIANSASLVILSGYMKKIGKHTRNAFPGRILNVHPALLPNYKGIWGDAVHSAVLAAKDKVTGVTIHQIDSIYDHGPILLQSKVPVLPNDTVESLRKRVQTEEVKAFIKLLTQIQQGKVLI